MSDPTPSLAYIGFGIGEAVLVFAILALLFGAKKLPMLARGIGQGIRNFKGELKNPDDGDESE